MTIVSELPLVIPELDEVGPTDALAAESTRRLTIANIWVAVIAFAVATAMAVMQAMSRANLDLPGRSPRMYYLSVTAHGVLMALVFTTFFIMALGWAVVREERGAMKWPRASWIAYWAAVGGVVMTTWTILTHRASVLYTFYPPMQAHPAFYIGLTIVVVASLEWAASIVATWWELRRSATARPVSLAHPRHRRRDALPVDSLVVRLDADRRSAARANAVLVLRPSPRVFLDPPRVHDLVHGPAP